MVVVDTDVLLLVFAFHQDARHFQDKSALPVMTPAAYLALE